MKPPKKYRPMRLLYHCPLSAAPVWANPKNKDLGYRCTKCGQEHA